jgi:hypothetical protein
MCADVQVVERALDVEGVPERDAVHDEPSAPI